MNARDLDDDMNRDALMIRQERSDECNAGISFECSSDSVEANTHRGQITPQQPSDDITQHGADEEYSLWLNERDHIEAEREAEQEFWAAQERLQAAADDGG